MKKFIVVILSIVFGVNVFAQTNVKSMEAIQSQEDNIHISVNIADFGSDARARRYGKHRICEAVVKQMDEDVSEELIESNINELKVDIDGKPYLLMYVSKSALKKSAETQEASASETVAPIAPSHNVVAVTPQTPSIDVFFRFSDESSVNVDKSAMEANITKLLRAINQAYNNNSATVDTQGISMTDDCRQSILDGWKHKPYFCKSTQNVKRCLYAAENMTVRDIPVYSKNDEEHERNISIAFNKQGQIECVRFAADIASYDKIMRQGGKEITDAFDAACRTSILSFVENYRNYYINMDIANIDRVFADDAIIITGSVIKTMKRQKGDNNNFKLAKSVRYDQKRKEEYIESLRKLFARNKEINVIFDDIKVIQDPNRGNIYGVTLKQHWDSKSKAGGHYSDDGHIFLLWDFANPEQPQIHIRTWQPEEVISSENDVFNLNSFAY